MELAAEAEIVAANMVEVGSSILFPADHFIVAHTTESRTRAYNKLKQRREDWFKQNGPCRICSSWSDLQLDHVDPSQKENHKVWSWSEERRINELSKCQALCRNCHKEKTKQESKALRGLPNIKLRKIDEEQVCQARKLHDSGISVREIAPLFGVAHNTLAVAMNRQRQKLLLRDDHARDHKD